MILVVESFSAAAVAGKKAALRFERISAAEAAEICYAAKEVVSAVSDPAAAKAFTDILGCRIECFEMPSLNLEKDTLLLGELILGKYPAVKDIYFKNGFHIQWFLIKKI